MYRIAKTGQEGGGSRFELIEGTECETSEMAEIRARELSLETPGEWLSVVVQHRRAWIYIYSCRFEESEPIGRR